jgi:hypothetical protein
MQALGSRQLYWSPLQAKNGFRSWPCDPGSLCLKTLWDELWRGRAPAVEPYTWAA